MSLVANKRKTHRSKSLSPSPINPYNQRTCKYHHGNKKIDTSASSTFACNDCKSKIKRYGIIYGCLRCKFYLCQPCFRKPSCPNGHLLKPTHVSRNTTCSVCKYKSKKQRLQMYQCNLCKFKMCLGCYSYETCSGNHGLKWMKIKSTTHKSMVNCHKCQRIFKINKSLFMCKKCKYALCGDCYQPSLTLKSKIHRQQKMNEKIRSNQQQHIEQNMMNDNDGLGQENQLLFEHEEEEKSVVLTDDHLAVHNHSYAANLYGSAAAAQGQAQPLPPPQGQGQGQGQGLGFAQSYHSYSHSNSLQSASKSRERERAKKKKKSNKKKEAKSSKTKKKKTKTKAAQINNGNTPSLSLSATSSVNMPCMPYNESEINEFSSSFSGIESCAPSEMTRIPSILTDCCICMERDKRVAFLPCGHYIACEKCAKLLKNDTGMCAICSMKIQSILTIYE